MSILHLTCFKFNEIYHLLYKQISDQFCLAHLWGKDPLPLSFPISWYCKLDIGMQKPKLHPELFMKPTGFNLTCCSDLPISQALYQPGMVLNPGGPESLKWSTSSAPPPLQFTKQQPKVWIDLDPGTTQPEGNFTPLQLQLLSEISGNVYGKHVR